MKKIAAISIIIGLLFTLSCEKPLIGYKYNTGSLPETPINLSAFNTEYDDYNSTAPSLGELIPFCFSTNRHTRGEAFDIIYMPMNVNFDKTLGALKVTNEYANWRSLREEYDVIRSGVAKIQTLGNELGPNLIIHRGIRDVHFTLLYATDITGNAQINFVSNRTTEYFSEPQEVAFLNSEADDLYPTFNAAQSKIYFCSNRNDATFNIYTLTVNPEKDIELMLTDSSKQEVIKEAILSSTADDKCPFILENKLVFASNRAGGFGGYDLYYSIFENDTWSAPINFGANINTEYDEYRPILIDEGVSWTQTMMVFSSNRTGGLGGFDLYFVGIENE